MLGFLADNIGTIVVSVILSAAMLLAVRKIYKDKKSGRPSCGGNCSGCTDCGMSQGENYRKR
ncbi:MAG: FeoB-associated Cys-rich membrane protein [Clostridium sp.]|nr:FeoB-associated Cys-rich membrane protein [Clostridium sp.]